jgi:hypothetical protein
MEDADLDEPGCAGGKLVSHSGQEAFGWIEGVGKGVERPGRGNYEEPAGA